MNNIFRITALMLSLLSGLVLSGTASATASPNGGANWGGTQGITTPDLWTQGHGNVVGAHFMRMMDGSMNPNGMLMQHHFANHDGTGATNPLLSNSLSGMHVMDQTNNSAGNLVVNVDNFVAPSFTSTYMRVEVLSFLGTGIASIDSATGTGSTTVTAGASGSSLGAVWPNNGSSWDYSYADFVFDGPASAEQIIISSLGSNIGQVFVWTEQLDVAAVPVPAAVWLFGSAIIGLFTTSRRRNIGAATAA